MAQQVSLPEMLDARERRAMEQHRLLETYHETLLCREFGSPGRGTFK